MTPDDSAPDDTAYRESPARPRSELIALGAWIALGTAVAFFGVATIGSLAVTLVPLFSGVWQIWAGVGFFCVALAFIGGCVLLLYRFYRRSPYRLRAPPQE
jgi:hypothetical protein